jgi:hypothetical protein
MFVDTLMGQNMNLPPKEGQQQLKENKIGAQQFLVLVPHPSTHHPLLWIHYPCRTTALSFWCGLRLLR